MGLMVVEAKIHRTKIPNIELLFSKYKVARIWCKVNSHFKKVTILDFGEAQKRKIKLALKELMKTGFIPYHYFLSNVQRAKFKHSGKEVLRFKGEIKEVIEFNGVNGKFFLIYIFGENNVNYLIKKYSESSVLNLPDKPVYVKGKLKAVIKDVDGNVFNLINHVRFSDEKI